MMIDYEKLKVVHELCDEYRLTQKKHIQFTAKYYPEKVVYSLNGDRFLFEERFINIDDVIDRIRFFASKEEKYQRIEKDCGGMKI